MSAALGQELLEPNEAQAIERMASTLHGLQKQEYADQKPMLRDAHGKHHGLVRADFTIEPNLPAELRVGVFAEPKTFVAYLRYSNGAGAPKNDAIKDVRGLAIKLLGVPGEKILEDEKDESTQDFLLITHHTFFVKALSDYESLFDALGAGSPLRHFFGWNPLTWKLRELGHILRASVAIANPLTTQYWSAVPCSFGLGRGAKFSARPQVIGPKKAPPGAGPNYLREAMVKTLSETDVVLDFLVQLQTDADRMPIEDPTVRWDESISPYRKVATVRIPKQRFDSPAQHELAENLSFNPWHSVAEHRPLGSMNRARKHIYWTISKQRHEHNGVPRREPDGTEISIG